MARWQNIFFALACGIYAIFSSPTPDQIGFAEALVFISMVLALLPDFSKADTALFFLGYGLLVPTIFSLVYGHSLAETMRDLIPFLFLLLPLFYSKMKEISLLSSCLTGIGLIFSLRTLFFLGAKAFTPVSWTGTPPDLLYLPNSPEVLFSCVLLLCLAFKKNEWKIRYKFLCLSGALINLWAMATLMQRISLAYISFLAAMWFLWLFWRRPLKGLAFGVFLSTALFLTHDFVFQIFDSLVFKTQMVGLNARSAEWNAVYHQVAQNPVDFFFGLGWGAEFENPAVGGLRVNFTHSLLSSLLLKTGVFGVACFLLYAGSLIRSAWPVLKRETGYAFALAAPLLIGLTLYANYKSLGYGLLLLLLSQLGRNQSLEKQSLSMP